jgi:hypothetical protein
MEFDADSRYPPQNGGRSRATDFQLRTPDLNTEVSANHDVHLLLIQLRAQGSPEFFQPLTTRAPSWLPPPRDIGSSGQGWIAGLRRVPPSFSHGTDLSISSCPAGVG